MPSLSSRVAIGTGANGLIQNADVESSAAIAGTKVSPDFGSQNIVTTGTCSCTSCNVSKDAASLAAGRYVRSFSDTVATTDATTTSVATFTVPTGSVVSIVADVAGVLADASAAASFRSRATFRNAAGVVTQVGTTSSLDTDADAGAAGWTCTIDSSGTSARVRVTGGVADSIRWTASVVAIVSKV